jgi:hypothetical protein
VGAILVSKAMLGFPVVANASTVTNVLNGVGTKLLPEAVTGFRIGTRILGSARLLTIAARANGVLSVGLLAYDVASIAMCTAGY